jgi:hypothetical protein
MTGPSQDTTNLLKALTTFLETLCSQSSVQQDNTKSPFKCVSVPEISLETYTKHVYHWMDCCESVIIMSHVLIERLFAVAPSEFSELSSHRILSSAFVISVKAIEDKHQNNLFYSKCCGVSKLELNMMESSFLNFLNFKVFVSDAQYTTCLRKLRPVMSPTLPATTPDQLLFTFKSHLSITAKNNNNSESTTKRRESWGGETVCMAVWHTESLEPSTKRRRVTLSA